MQGVDLMQGIGVRGEGKAKIKKMKRREGNRQQGTGKSGAGLLSVVF